MYRLIRGINHGRILGSLHSMLILEASQEPLSSVDLYAFELTLVDFSKILSQRHCRQAIQSFPYPLGQVCVAWRPKSTTGSPDHRNDTKTSTLPSTQGPTSLATLCESRFAGQGSQCLGPGVKRESAAHPKPGGHQNLTWYGLSRPHDNHRLQLTCRCSAYLS